MSTILVKNVSSNKVQLDETRRTLDPGAQGTYELNGWVTQALNEGRLQDVNATQTWGPPASGGGSSSPILDWTNVTLNNSSTPLGDPFELAVKVRVTADGTVQMKGMIQAGANLADTQAVCTLPAAARPSKIRRLLAHSAAGPLATNINPSGAVTFPNGLASGSWVSLDAVFSL